MKNKDTIESIIENYDKLPIGDFKTYLGGYIDGYLDRDKEQIFLDQMVKEVHKGNNNLNK